MHLSKSLRRIFIHKIILQQFFPQAKINYMMTILGLQECVEVDAWQTSEFATCKSYWSLPLGNHRPSSDSQHHRFMVVSDGQRIVANEVCHKHIKASHDPGAHVTSSYSWGMGTGYAQFLKPHTWVWWRRWRWHWVNSPLSLINIYKPMIVPRVSNQHTIIHCYSYTILPSYYPIFSS